MADYSEDNDANPFPEALGQSEAFLDFQERLSAVARVERPVLILGERGTGKELAARRLHFLSQRWEGPLVELNCAALSPTLIESELFGHEPGAFTGAAGRRQGRFETAHEGTLFLDELGNIPLPVQEKILRAVEYGSFTRVGGSDPVRVDVRIVGATNADLPALAEEGRFMRDLLDRLSFEVLYLPPLRERQEDILLLAHHFAARMTQELGRAGMPQFSDDAINALESHPWRGNVRELKNVVERAIYRAESETIDHLEFDPFRPGITPLPLPVQESPVEKEAAATTIPASFKDRVETLEIELLRHALKANRFNQKKAAAQLGLNYNQFRGLYRKYQQQLIQRKA
jgi:psp operon transcriptional activator